jgi:hypothetical protein
LKFHANNVIIFNELRLKTVERHELPNGELSAIILVVERAKLLVGTGMFCKQVTRSEKALAQA